MVLPKTQGFMPGSTVEYRASSEGSGRFCQLFVAYGCMIEGFVKECRPLLFIDSCFLKGDYKGCLFSACGLDANNGLYPLAYSIASSENDEDWDWFFLHLKMTLGDHEVVIFSDRNASLIKSIETYFGSEYNAWCLRHLKENFHSEITKKRGWKKKRVEYVLKALDRIAWARDECTYTRLMNSLLESEMECDGTSFSHTWISSNQPEHWANSKFKHMRWGWINNNPAESFNSMIRPIRHHSVFEFMKEHPLSMSNFLFEKKVEHSRSKTMVGNRIEKELLEKQLAVESLCWKRMAMQTFVVTDRNKQHFKVDLENKTCSCLEWSQTGIPCVHVLRVIEPSAVDLYSLVHHKYLNSTQERLLEYLIPAFNTNDQPFVEELDMGTTSYNLADDVDGLHTEPTPPLQPPLTKRKPGRPRKKRIESQRQDKRIMTCSRCSQRGHTRKSCNEKIAN